MAIALGLTPGPFNPNAKVDPRVLRPTPGQLPKPRRAGLRWVSAIPVAEEVSEVSARSWQSVGQDQ